MFSFNLFCTVTKIFPFVFDIHYLPQVVEKSDDQIQNSWDDRPRTTKPPPLLHNQTLNFCPVNFNTLWFLGMFLQQMSYCDSNHSGTQARDHEMSSATHDMFWRCFNKKKRGWHVPEPLTWLKVISYQLVYQMSVR